MVQNRQHLLRGGDPVRYCGAQRCASPAPEQGTLRVPRRDPDPALPVLRIAHHGGIEADRDVVEEHPAVDRADVDASWPTGLMVSAPQSLAKWLRVPQGTTTKGISCWAATPATALSVPSPPAAISTWAPSSAASRARAPAVMDA